MLFHDPVETGCVIHPHSCPAACPVCVCVCMQRLFYGNKLGVTFNNADSQALYNPCCLLLDQAVCVRARVCHISIHHKEAHKPKWVAVPQKTQGLSLPPCDQPQATESPRLRQSQAKPMEDKHTPPRTLKPDFLPCCCPKRSPYPWGKRRGAVGSGVHRGTCLLLGILGEVLNPLGGQGLGALQGQAQRPVPEQL